MYKGFSGRNFLREKFVRTGKRFDCIMKYVLDAAQAKSIDKYSIEYCNIPSLVLMERAALSVADAIMTRSDICGKNVLVLAGNGNNGADGVAVARILGEKQIPVSIYIAEQSDNITEEMNRQLLIARMLNIPIIDKLTFDEDTIFVDAMFGIGLSINVEGVYKTVADTVNSVKNQVVAVDIPSGVNATTGQIMGTAVKADITVTFGYYKTGQLLYPGAAYCGKILVYDIGFASNAIKTIDKPKFTMDISDIALLPKRRADGHKGTFGKVLVIAGSEDICGAAVLSAMGALKTGCGMVRVFTHVSNKIPLLNVLPEVLTDTYDKEIDWGKLHAAMDWADSIVIGPGLGTKSLSKSILGFVMENTQKPLVIDADAINIISENQSMLSKVKENHIFTPHIMEMARLLNVNPSDIKKDETDVCRLFAVTNKCVCILKDSRSIVAKFNQKVYINTMGNSGMATAGSGDVLTGIVAAFLAGGTESFTAACYGTLIHSLAGDFAAEELTEYSMTAVSIADNIYKVFKEKR